jgi:hypothetical protein
MIPAECGGNLPNILGEGNVRFFNCAISLRSAGMSLKDIEQKLRDEAEFGRTPAQRRAQIPSIMNTLRRPRPPARGLGA